MSYFNSFTHSKERKRRKGKNLNVKSRDMDVLNMFNNSMKLEDVPILGYGFSWFRSDGC